MQTLLSTVPPTSKNYNVSARVVLPNLSQQPATALLSELHWLPVNSRITFKLACNLLTTSPQVNLLICARYYTSTRTLRSTNQFFLDVPRFSTEFDKRSFSYLAPTVWNGLPLNIRLSPIFDTSQTPSENSPFSNRLAHQHPYHAASASDSVPLLNVRA